MDDLHEFGKAVTVPADALINVLIIGAGSRGNAYTQAIKFLARPGWVVRAVAEPDSLKREAFGRHYIWGEDATAGYGQSFTGWQDFVEWETARRRTPSSAQDAAYQPIDACFICCLDSMHHPAITALAPLNLHILCEKPLCTSLAHSIDVASTLASHHSDNPRAVSIGHVLRYSNFNMTLRRLLCEELAIGEVISMEHTEPIGWHHFPHSYVRGNWRREFEDPDGQGGRVGTLLTKSCHDVDLIMWLLASPSLLTGSIPHLPATITSSGSLHHFRKARKPKAAGTATNCLSCPLKDEGCIHSAKRSYVDRLAAGMTHWPLNVVVPDIEDILRTAGREAADKALHSALADDYDATITSDDIINSRNWYGRCAYESNNNVVDNQTVVITWDEEALPTSDQSQAARNARGLDPLFGRGPKTAVFHMTYPTEAVCERRGRIYGTLGEISYDSHTLTVTRHGEEMVRYTPKGQDVIVGEGHGGGDLGLTKNFLSAVNAIKSGAMDAKRAQEHFIGCDVDEIIRSHAVVFAAEHARQTRTVVDWGQWWEEKQTTLMATHEHEVPN